VVDGRLWMKDDGCGVGWKFVDDVTIAAVIVFDKGIVSMPPNLR
jgi:hypothetical protein